MAYEDGKIFEKLKSASEKLNRKNKDYRVLLLYGLFADRENKTDIMQTIRITDNNLFVSILSKFAKVSFFLTKEKYDKYIRGKDIIGDYENYYAHPDHRTQFVTSTEVAEKVVTEMMKLTSIDAQSKYFELNLGYEEGYFKMHLLMYRIDLDGTAVQKANKELKATRKTS